MTEHKNSPHETWQGSHHEIWSEVSELRDQIRLLQAQIQLLEEVQKSLIKRARRLEDERKQREKDACS